MVADKNKTRKAATLMEKQGFRDRDLYNRAHDRICAWLYKNIDVLHAGLIEQANDERKGDIDTITDFCTSLSIKMPDMASCDSQPAIQIEKKPEYLVKQGSYPAGFIDLVVIITFQGIRYRVCLMNYRQEPIGYITFDQFKREYKDIASDGRFYNSESFHDVEVDIDFVTSEIVYCYHVKSAYESMGALKREINFYKEYIHSRDRCRSYNEIQPKRIVYHKVVGPRKDDVENEMRQIDCGFIEAPTELLKEIADAKKPANTLF
jgi:hypothetical protein